LLGVGIDPSNDFRVELLTAAAVDAFRGFILFHHGAPIAFNYAFATGNILVGAKMGYNPDFAQLSPGTVLFFLMVERLFSGDRFRRLDLAAGSWDYKARYSTGTYQAADVYYFPRNRKNLTFVYTHAVVQALSDVLMKSLNFGMNQLGIKGQRKRALQARLKKFRLFPGSSSR
jgi:CelD/BcsL family acetyltransferase involved in cellulose biosynthesis